MIARSELYSRCSIASCISQLHVDMSILIWTEAIFLKSKYKNHTQDQVNFFVTNDLECRSYSICPQFSLGI